jgi:purine nucleoside phosphorylase
MYQPLCRTFDSEGGVRFTGASDLFNPGLKDGVEQFMKRRKMDYSTGIVAALSHPRLLSPAEKEVLRKMGAVAAVDRLYLNARAARACGVPAVGLAAVAESSGQLQQIVPYLLEYLMENKFHL